MNNSVSRNIMNGSVLYILPDSSNSSILNKAVPKTRSLSDLEIVLKTPSEDVHADRRNSVSGPVPMDTTLSSTAPTVETLLGPFKTLQEAQVAASLFKHSGMPASVNLHQNISGRPNLFMSTKSSTNYIDNQEVSIALSPHINFSKESKTLIEAKPLPSKGNHQVCSENTDASKMQVNSCISLTSSPQVSLVDIPNVSIQPQLFLPASVKGTGDIEECQKDIAINQNACETKAGNPSVKKKSLIRTREKKKNNPVTKVVSLVFFDLETTGLACQIGKSNVQITEISMIAINRKEFEQSTFEDLRDIRIIQKLCLCTRPRSVVSSGAAVVTGLNNENLMDQTPFEHSAAEAINYFLSHLPKPVCLLAHNGNTYDFPLLKAEFSRLSISLPPDILIADTLKAFRVLGVPVFPPGKKICKSVKFTKKGQVSYSLSNLHLYFFNKNPTGSHSSEGDCIALAKVCHRMKDLMLLWFDENCTTFDSVSPMW